MKLHQIDKENITQHLIDSFSINEEKAQFIIDKLDETLMGKNKDFFYHIKYSIHFRNDPYYSMKLLKFAIETFSSLLLLERYSQHEEELSAFLYLFFETMFIERCRYASKIERRSNSVQKILLHMSEQLNATLDTQQLMIANISHDMRTSLNAISGYISIIEGKNILQGEEKSFLHKAGNASLTLRGLVSDILDITKINSGQMEIKKELFWLDEVINECLDTVTLGLSNKNIVFKTKIDFFPRQLWGDHQHITGVLINLLSNAIKYTDNGFIELMIAKEQVSTDRIKISFKVKDSGIGMSKEQTERIFDPYSRFSLQQTGVGLGMHIASKLVQKMGGSLKVKSKLGKGSTFDFTIVLKEEPVKTKKVKNRSVYVFNQEGESGSYKQKGDYLRKFGVKVSAYDNEQVFINSLLSPKEKAPDIISIISDQEGYAKFDALINYLKTLELYQETLFIAEETGRDISLEYFDMIYQYCTPISIYIDALNLSGSETKQGVSPKSLKNVHILAVDDIETNLEILKMFIKKQYPTINIDLAAGGYEAIGMYKAKEYDLILMDIKMPGLNGFDVINKLKDIRPLPVTYALTADIYKTTYNKVIQTGFTGLLEKPLQPEVLFKAIDRVIYSKK